MPAERTPEPVRSFGSFTRDLHELADWLQECRVRTVAMESTGVYWIPFYQILEIRGFQVFLVNAQHVKNVLAERVMFPIASGFSSRLIAFFVNAAIVVYLIIRLRSTSTVQ